MGSVLHTVTKLGSYIFCHQAGQLSKSQSLSLPNRNKILFEFNVDLKKKALCQDIKDADFQYPTKCCDGERLMTMTTTTIIIKYNITFLYLTLVLNYLMYLFINYMVRQEKKKISSN